MPVSYWKHCFKFPGYITCVSFYNIVSAARKCFYVNCVTVYRTVICSLNTQYNKQYQENMHENNNKINISIQV